MKKILVISDEFPPNSGGAGYVGKQIVEGLVSKGHKVSLLTNHRIASIEKVNMYTVFRVKFLWILLYYIKFFFIEWNKYNAIILNDSNTIIPFLFFFNKKARKKTHLIIHGTTIIDNYSNKVNFLYKWGSPFFNRLLLEVKNVIGVSEFMASYVKENYPELENIIVWNPGVSFDAFKKNSQVIRKSTNISILTVSRIVKQKGFDEMFEVFKKVVKDENKFVWNIIGEGTYMKEFKNKIDIQGYSNKIIFHSKLERIALTEKYLEADVFMLLSNFKESLGLVYLEAQYFGTPVISNNSGGPKEIISTETGYLINNPDEVIAILTMKVFLELNKNKIIKNALKFDSRKSLLKLEQLLDCNYV